MPNVLALDVGGTKVATGVVDAAGKLSRKRQIPTVDPIEDSLYERVLELVRNTLLRTPGSIEAIGVGCGGPAKNSYQLVSPLNIPEWNGFPLREKLENDLQISTYVDNDAKALALAEGWVGTAKNCKNFIAMVVSTGVGGGIVLNGTLLEGRPRFVQPAVHGPNTVGQVLAICSPGLPRLAVRGLSVGLETQLVEGVLPNA